MKAFSQALHLELEQQLQTIHRQMENPTVFRTGNGSLDCQLGKAEILFQTL